METTYQELFNFRGTAHNWFARTKEEMGSPNGTKLGYALYRMLKQTDKWVEQYQEDLRDGLERIQIMNCAVDDKKRIERDENKQLKFTPDGMIKAQEEQRKFGRELLLKPLEIGEPYYATEMPEEPLWHQERDAFLGFVIPINAPMRLVPESVSESVS